LNRRSVSCNVSVAFLPCHAQHFDIGGIFSENVYFDLPVEGHAIYAQQPGCFCFVPGGFIQGFKNCVRIDRVCLIGRGFCSLQRSAEHLPWLEWSFRLVRVPSPQGLARALWCVLKATRLAIMDISLACSIGRSYGFLGRNPAPNALRMHSAELPHYSGLWVPCATSARNRNANRPLRWQLASEATFGWYRTPWFDPFMLLDGFHPDNPSDYLEGFPRRPLRDRDNQIRFPQPGRLRRQYGKQADGESNSLVRPSVMNTREG